MVMVGVINFDWNVADNRIFGFKFGADFKKIVHLRIEKRKK